uniref:Uncharacterized protein n=2 Tax=Octactis speculum TaxID=3111310 RepID=A0A7S2B897_9STRA|mmetsp:Transcript_20713/g.28161  ORF Transcript_20713/g.28161 Transcript_20713/m.28161 type:complete len:215 (+) Transcript_20713:44-688(+)
MASPPPPSPSPFGDMKGGVGLGGPLSVENATKYTAQWTMRVRLIWPMLGHEFMSAPTIIKPLTTDSTSPEDKEDINLKAHVEIPVSITLRNALQFEAIRFEVLNECLLVPEQPPVKKGETAEEIPTKTIGPIKVGEGTAGVTHVLSSELFRVSDGRPKVVSDVTMLVNRKGTPVEDHCESVSLDAGSDLGARVPVDETVHMRMAFVLNEKPPVK